MADERRFLYKLKGGFLYYFYEKVVCSFGSGKILKIFILISIKNNN
jgi:hypothetical protein